MSEAFWISLGVLLVLYGAVVYRQLSGRGPEVAYLFLGAALLLVALGVIGPVPALLAVSLPVLTLLFGMFVFVIALDRAGALSHLARWMASRARRPGDLPLYLFLGLGLLSTFVLNDAIAILGVPLVLALARRLRVEPVPLLLTLAYAVTVGSVLTPLGNPQNLLVAVGSGMHDPMGSFVLYLALPTAVNLLLGAVLLRRWLGPRLANAQHPEPWNPEPLPLFPRGGWGRRLREHPSILLFPATLVTLLTFSFGNDLGLLPNVPIYEFILAGALLVLALEPGREKVLQKVDYLTLGLFVGLFIVMAAMVDGGVVSALASGFSFTRPVAGHPTFGGLGSFMFGTVGAVQIFSNVPWVALSVPLLQAQGYGPGNLLPWLSLAAASTLGGNLTFLGAASNLIIVNQAERAGFRLRLGEFVRYGAPLTLLTVTTTLVLLYFRL